VTPNELHFRAYESDLQKIVNNYPNPSVIQTLTSASTIRQHLRKALGYLVSQPPEHLASDIDREAATQLLSHFVFSETTDGRVYIGPRRVSNKLKHLAVSTFDPSAPAPIPPIDVSNPAVRASLFTLKNLDVLPIQFSITNLTPAAFADATQRFPNIELVQGPQPGCYTLI